MNNNKQKSSVEWFAQESWKLRVELEDEKISLGEYANKYYQLKEQAKAIHKEEVKNAYISGYLDNGYYEGAEEDASKLWEDTYGFAHNATFGGNNED
jgi:hypothetical protein